MGLTVEQIVEGSRITRGVSIVSDLNQILQAVKKGGCGNCISNVQQAWDRL
jgi:hypothetical protein